MKEDAKIIPIRQRSPEEIAAFHDGFNAAIRMAVDSISTNKSRTKSRGDTFRDGMDYAVHCIEFNADAFRRLALSGGENGQGKSLGTDED